MKKILFALMLELSASAFSQVMPNDVTVRQRRADDTGYLDRFVSFPSGGASCLFSLDGPSVLPNCYQIGTGLNLASGILSVSSGGSQIQSDWLQTNTSSADYVKNKPLTYAPSPHTHAISDVTNLQTSLDGKQATLGFTPYNATNPAGYVSQAGARSAISLTTTGSGAATYSSATGVLNVPIPAAAAPFNFSQPTIRNLAVSTSYQALDSTKAAVIIPSYSCQNATTVVASSACTIQVRMGTGTLTCSTGTAYYTQSLTVQLGLLITQNSINPVQINLPIGGSFILCPQAGTFTISAAEQSAG